MEEIHNNLKLKHLAAFTLQCRRKLSSKTDMMKHLLFLASSTVFSHLTQNFTPVDPNSKNNKFQSFKLWFLMILFSAIIIFHGNFVRYRSVNYFSTSQRTWNQQRNFSHTQYRSSNHFNINLKRAVLNWGFIFIYHCLNTLNLNFS